VKVNHNHALKDKGVSNTLQSSLLPRHRWYSYKEGFSPSLVNHAITNLKDFDKNNDIIFDPFNGSGTVTLFSSLKGYNSIGIEVNPFSVFISKVKEINLSKQEMSIFQKEKDYVIKKCRIGKKSPLLNFSTFSEKINNKKWLFNPHVLNSFEGGYNYLNSIGNTKIRSLLKLALVNSAMDNCNAKKDGKCLRYKKDWKDKDYNINSFIDSIELNINNYLEDINRSSILCKSKILKGDSRHLLKTHSTKFKLCLTSPPYLNSFDYTDIYRPELFLGHFITLPSDLYKLRSKTLRSHINHIETFSRNKSFGANYDKVIQSINESNISLWSSKIPSMIQSYFEDMEIVLTNLRRNASENAQLWLIVGNSAYADLEIPTDLILAEIGGRCKWYLQEIGVLRYLHKRGSKYSPNISMLRESVIIFSTGSKT